MNAPEAAERLAALLRIASPAGYDAGDQLARQHRREWLEQRVRRDLPDVIAWLERAGADPAVWRIE